MSNNGPAITPLQWWSGLSPSTRAELIANSESHVPPECLIEVLHAAGYPIGTQWPGAEMGETGLGLPAAFRDHVAGQRTPATPA